MNKQKVMVGMSGGIDSSVKLICYKMMVMKLKVFI